MRPESLVDAFVAAVNTGFRIPVEESDSPASVYVGDPDEHGCRDWQIKPYPSVDWVEPLEQMLPARFPRLYRSLIARYIFPSFELKQTGVFLFGNTPEGTDYYELRNRIFRDPHLSQILLSHGYLQFGCPDDMSYDPVCFDTNRRRGSDCPIVRIDHEGILCWDQVRVMDEMAESFLKVIRKVIGDREGPGSAP